MRRLILTLAFGIAALPALGATSADDDLPQFPKIAPPDTLPDAACDASLAHTRDWAMGTWSAYGQKIEIAANHWRATGGSDSEGTVVTVEQCTIHLGGNDPQHPGFDAIRTESGALYGGMRHGDAAPRFDLFHKREP